MGISSHSIEYIPNLPAEELQWASPPLMNIEDFEQIYQQGQKKLIEFIENISKQLEQYPGLFNALSRLIPEAKEHVAELRRTALCTDLGFPLCLFDRFKLIEKEIATVCGITSGSLHLAPYAAAVLHMLAIQIGRLTVRGSDDSDAGAHAYEIEAFYINKELETLSNSNFRDKDLATPVQQSILAFWERLNTAWPECACIQCTRRVSGSEPAETSGISDPHLHIIFNQFSLKLSHHLE